MLCGGVIHGQLLPTDGERPRMMVGHQLGLQQVTRGPVSRHSMQQSTLYTCMYSMYLAGDHMIGQGGVRGQILWLPHHREGGLEDYGGCVAHCMCGREGLAGQTGAQRVNSSVWHVWKRGTSWTDWCTEG